MARYTRNEASTVPQINTELEKIEAAIEDSLSRKGDAPNSMSGPLDMNNQRILNIPAPVDSTDPLRKIDGEQYVTAAATSAAEALESEQNAAASATSAAASASSASSDASVAAGLIEDLNAIYLGAFTTGPETDNEGNPLQQGALYYNTISKNLLVFNGTSWVISTSQESAAAAELSAVNAALSAAAALASEGAAQDAENLAEQHKDSALASASSASSSASAASASQSAAATSATNAATSASQASSSASAASASASAAAVSETNASNSESAAATSESNAASSASAALSSEAEAATSEINAATSETNAAASEAAAANSATVASTKATEASDSAAEALASEIAAQAAQAATEQIFDQFGDQYLGPKTSDPTVDNDGDPLTEGDIYFNTTDNVLKFYAGTAWVAPEDIATSAAAAALASEQAAAASESAAAASEANAATSETNAAASATAASGSATAASNSAAAAAGSATSAASSATSASNSASTALQYLNDTESVRDDVVQYGADLEASIDDLVSKQSINDFYKSSLVLDFAKNDFRVYEPFVGLERKQFLDIGTVVRNTSKTGWTPTGLQTAGVNVPIQNQQDPSTGEPLGIFIEEARTNLFFSSSDFDSANWSKSASLVVSDVNSVIQGQTANRLTGGGVFEESVNQSKTITGTSATAYIIIESGTSAVSSLRLRDATASANVGLIGIDWATEALITTSGTGKLTKLSNSSVNGGKLFLLEINASVTSGNLFLLNFFPNGVAPQGGVASTDNCIIHHAQLEAGSSASSPIVTAGTSITRLADAVTVPDLSGWFNPSEGTFVVEYEYNQLGGVVSRNLLAVGQLVASRIEIYHAGGNNPTILAGGGSATTIGTAVAGRNKIALKFTADGLKASYNGGAVVSASIGTTDYANFTMLRVGTNVAPGNYWRDTIANIQYYPKAVSDAQLQELSAL